jgi:LacI family transcriptional regulator
VATLKDVVEKTGLSASAVSAVLNGSGGDRIRVSIKTRARIEAAAAELGYVPNRLARSLATGRSGVLGLVFPYSRAYIDRGPFCSEVMWGVFEEAIVRKYNLMLHTAVGDGWNEADEDSLIDRRVDGHVLVLPTPHSPVVARFHRERFPYVTLVYKPESPDEFSVNADEFGGGKLATEHLIELGHRRIAHIVGPARVASSAPRRDGYLAALRQAGIESSPELVATLDDWPGDGYEVMKRLLDLPPAQRPTALFAFNDPAAESAMRAARDRGMRLPDDLAVVGFDDTWLATSTQPQLTSVRMPIREMAITATEMLIERVEGRPVFDRQIVLPVSLTVRASSRGPLSPGEGSEAPAPTI